MEPETAHEGMIESPASPEWNDEGLQFGVCEKCHDDVTEFYAESLHYTQNGQVNSMISYTHEGILAEGTNAITKGWELDCNECHAECGGCHVSRPKVQEGGLLSAHQFEKVPPMEKTCVGCHSTRNGGEFIGNVGPAADTHYYDYDMVCTDCHPKSNFHGTGDLPENMHVKEDLPTCISANCHADTLSEEKGIEMHLAHEDPDLLSCSVCHSQEAHGCSDCHVSYKDEKQNSVLPSSKVIDVFKIAKNPNPTELHPNKFITVRHMPMVRDSLEGMGYPELDNFDKISSWKESPTHNTQLYTPQAADCNSCHGVEKVFLTEEDILPTDSKASLEYVVTEIPEAIEAKK
ncbi:hypothetical protein MFMK1_002996 [Metallumcola ferriviriculae]|uniref:Uncharacterized protein n=1 Tax=Metallumcola ferriviriculae TaxID=3039180 RepID=A0AAU0URX3_9FIRM|nr:hypothetical protein MFMK1_002996 [Desulfitibacteraceae bacterium MK1]